MKSSIQSAFEQQFPGPYRSCPGVDGVDRTFDVICKSSGDTIVSTYFWENKETCRLIAAFVTAALNIVAGYPARISSTDVAAYFKAFPGPFVTRSDECSGRRPCVGVYCTATTADVIHAYGLSFAGEAAIIADHIAESLNRIH